MDSDEEPYVASSQSRCVKPGIVAVLGDVVRRMKMFRGTNVAIGRKGFDADLKAVADSSYEEFMEAMRIANPRETIASAANRADMPPKVRTALRTLLLSTSAVPGTEGRKKEAPIRWSRCQPPMGTAELLQHAQLCRHVQSDREAPP